MQIRESETYINYQGELKKYQGEYLPHWEVDDGIYFVTFRLANSLPKERLESLKNDYHRLMEKLRHSDDAFPEDMAKVGFEFFLEDVDQALDQAEGECWLRRPEIASLVQEALEYFDGERYDLYTWCLMPNHVHVTYRKYPDYTLEDIHHSWKSYTGTMANRLLNRVGKPFWQADSYERLVRSTEEFVRISEYVWRNPPQAGLEDWPWRGTGDVGGALAA